MIVYTLRGQEIKLNDVPVAAAGGEGTVFAIQSGYDHANHCVKIYHVDCRTITRHRKVDFMTKNEPEDIIGQYHKICWPRDLVFDKEKKFMGFIMPLAFQESEKLYELTTLRIKDSLSQKWLKFERSTSDSLRNRIKVCINIAIAIHHIHSTGKYTLVDYKPQNLLITNSGQISLTDIDSLQISNNGSVTFHAPVTTAEYAPPEAKTSTLGKSFITENWDRFSLAVSFYELLLGLHPFSATAGNPYSHCNEIFEKINHGLFVHGNNKKALSAIPLPHQNFERLPNTIQQYFHKAFDGSQNGSVLRPSAEEWGQAFQVVLKFPINQLQGISIRKPTKPIITTPTLQSRPAVITNPLSPSPQKPPKDNFMVKIAAGIVIGGFVLYFATSKPTGAVNNDNNTPLDTPASTFPATVKESYTQTEAHLPAPTLIKPKPVEPVGECFTQTGNVVVNKTSDHNIVLHIRFMSQKTKRYGPWKEFSDIPSGETVLTDDNDNEISTSSYLYYTEDADGAGKHSSYDPMEVKKCNGSLILIL